MRLALGAPGVLAKLKTELVSGPLTSQWIRVQLQSFSVMMNHGWRGILSLYRWVGPDLEKRSR